MTSLFLWMAAVVVFGLCVIFLMRAESRMDAEGNQIGDVRRARRVAILGMILAAALAALGFFGTQWWQ
ncbi:MAG TPA: hypothetical protein VJQ82_00035 [Terriglobales bacterium]|nr:hypothetical protein [Terriglobales bacterium]